MTLSQPPGQTWARQEDETGFTAILTRLLRAMPGAIGVALVDGEGEAVDYIGETIDPFELKVAGAHWQIILREIDRGEMGTRGGITRRLSVETERRIFVLETLPDGYSLMSIMRKSAAIGHADRALDIALRDLYREAGWSAPPDLLLWHEVEIAIDGERPKSIKVGKSWVELTMIGRVAAGLRRDERGYRVSADTAQCELTVVLGRDGLWYADFPPDSLKPR